MAAAPPSPSVKGIAFGTVMKIVRAQREPAVVERALEAMSEEVRDALRYGTIIASGWYPVSWYRAMWSGILAATDEGLDFVRFVGRTSVDVDFPTLYRAAFRVLSPRTLVTLGLKHFKQIYDTGSVEVLESRPTSVRVKWTGCVGFDRTMWTEVFGSCERLAELAGGKAARMQAVEAGGDDDHCVAVAHWR